MTEKCQTVKSTLVFFVNGKKVEEECVDPEWTLLYYLRKKLGLFGTKVVCGVGGCGACTVMVSRYDRVSRKEIHIPINACLAPVCSMHGLSVITVEGIGSTRTKLHPVQERIAKAHGIQCGFCIPGIVMSMYVLLRQQSKPKMSDIEETFQGNLCRCGGYRAIIEGCKSFAEDSDGACLHDCYQSTEVCKMGEKCCIFLGSRVTWYRPATKEELLDLKFKYPESKIVVGNTEIGVETKYKSMIFPILIHPIQITSLTEITECSEGIKIGAAATLADIKTFLDQIIRRHFEDKTQIFIAFNKILSRFADKQTRSVGCIGGNILTGNPISDLVPILLACNAKLEVQSKYEGTVILTLDNKFYTGLNQTILKPSQVLLFVMLPFSQNQQYFEAYKHSRRRDDDIAIVNMAINVIFKDDVVIDHIQFGIGGMSYKTVDAPKTQQQLKGLKWSKDTLDLALTLLLEDLPLDPDAPGGMIKYRGTLVLSLFVKAFLTISEKLQESSSNLIEDRELSASHEFKSFLYKSSQYFTVVKDKSKDSLQKPLMQTSAYKLACGEAVFVDDMPHIDNELFVALILSEKAHAKIIGINANEALKIGGVVGILSDEDIDDQQNNIGFFFEGDEKMFYSRKVTSVGQIIGAIVAQDEMIARNAVKCVNVQYEELHPIVVSIEDAIKYGSYHEEIEPLDVCYGDVEASLGTATHRIKGVCRTGNQKNFYLETQSVLCVPKEEGSMEIYSSTQCPMDLARHASKLLGVSINKISVITKRIGGAFGGKQWKSIFFALPAIWAAQKYRRPVRSVLDRTEDMVMNGGRSSYLFEYQVGFNDVGMILGCDFDVYLNGGYSLDNTTVGVGQTLSHLDNAFNLTNIKARAKICKTNTPSTTAMRGFGAPEATFASLCIIDEIAEYLKKDFIEVVRENIYKDGDISYYKQEVDGSVKKCFEECLEQSNIYDSIKDAEIFNKKNRYKKRGVAIVPTKHGIGVNAKTPSFCQAAALVNVYVDGSVLLHHGGVEMGQGLHTKMIQIATRIFEISADKICTDSTATNIVPNCNRTIASLSSDLFGPAVTDACTKIKERLEPFKENDPNGTWEDWVSQAYLNKVSLSATGFYMSPNVTDYDPNTKTGQIFDYFVCGAGCSEVEIDTLTGDHQVLSTTLVMDLGESMNPAIDIGQIEGAFMQGYGLFVMEESVFSPNGQLYSKGPGAYKIPTFSDVPGKFKVFLLKGTSNPRAVYSSKAVGEPPLGLATSVFFAIKNAIKAARTENGISTIFKLDAPATAERIRMACIDKITERVPDPPESPTWSVVW